MKNLLLSSILLFSSISFSQLMRSEVYDFSVGDYFGLKNKATYQGMGMLTVRYQMFHILTKQLSVTGDSVTYSAQRQSYFPPLPSGSGGITPPSYSVDTFAFIHTNLNTPYSPAIWDHVFGNYATWFWESDTTGCYSSVDTIIPSPWCFNNSGQAYHFGMHIGNMDSCITIEPFISDYYAYSHAGGPYGGKECPGDPSVPSFWVELFYVVHNGVECGQFPDFFLGLEDYNRLSLEVYPNPVDDKLTIRGVESIQSFLITSSDGKMIGGVTLENNNIIDVAHLKKGIYFLHLKDFSGRNGTIRFVK